MRFTVVAFYQSNKCGKWCKMYNVFFCNWFYDRYSIIPFMFIFNSFSSTTLQLWDQMSAGCCWTFTAPTLQLHTCSFTVFIQFVNTHAVMYSSISFLLANSLASNSRSSLPFRRRSGLHLLGPPWFLTSRVGPVQSRCSAACWFGTADRDQSSGPPGRGRLTFAAWGASCPVKIRDGRTGKQTTKTGEGFRA